MKKTLIGMFVLLVFIATIRAEGEKKYGKELTLTETTKISSIFDKPEEFVGKKVLVEGTIVSVCSKRGCWIELASDEAHQKIKVKVEDGVIVFPMDALGKKALVEGEIYSLTPVHDEHSDEESCSTTEACSHEKEEVKKIYQIQGLGAVIQ